MEPHHDPGAVDVARIVDLGGEHVPADLTLRVDDGVLRVEVPLERPAHRVVPDGAHALRGRGEQVVDEVETVGEGLRGLLLHLDVKGLVGLPVGPGGIEPDGGRRDLILLLDRFVLTLVHADVLHLDRVEVVRIKTEDGDAAVGAQRRRAHVVAHFLTALFRHHAHVRGLEHPAAVLDHGRERRDVIGVVDDFTDLSLRLEGDGVAARSSGRGSGAADGQRGSGRQHVNQVLLHRSVLLSFCPFIGPSPERGARAFPDPSAPQPF